MRLIIKVANKKIQIKPEKVTLELGKKGAFANVVSVGEVIPGLLVQVETRVEYDGVAISHIRVESKQPIEIEAFNYEVDIPIRSTTKVISFKANQIRRQKDRNDFIASSYSGDFLNVIGLSDGNRSFWWFADHAKGWIWNDKNVTEISRSKSYITLRQKLIGKKWVIMKPMPFKMNFMASPARKIGSSWRSKGALIGEPNKKEKKLSSVLKLL